MNCFDLKVVDFISLFGQIKWIFRQSSDCEKEKRMKQFPIPCFSWFSYSFDFVLGVESWLKRSILQPPFLFFFLSLFPFTMPALKGISSCIPPELLCVLAKMGHGDRIGIFQNSMLMDDSETTSLWWQQLPRRLYCQKLSWRHHSLRRYSIPHFLDSSISLRSQHSSSPQWSPQALPSRLLRRSPCMSLS